ncbi:MAG: hypothetical protein KDA85_14570 [Planctomycetaceae bacterium]|nr:hypothetical protein [Planctomycetaceae bacterium]
MSNRVRSFSLSTDELSSLIPEFDAEPLPLEVQELYEAWSASGDAVDLTNTAVAESDWPVSIYVPERYEERYAYPLVIWFHSDDTDEDQLEDVMAAISSQNYCGLALRGNKYCNSTGGYRWDTNQLTFSSVPLHSLLQMTTCRLRRAFHIHSERIFLAGAGSGADTALRMLVCRPDWFAGAVLFDPIGDNNVLRSERLTALRGKPILTTASRNSNNEQLAAHLERIRLLRGAGTRLEVTLRDEVVDPVSSEVRFVDHWIMQQMQRTALV